ncbi:uncharacterized protein LOC144437058 isoform X2 [Glandiceps talaboti]
MAGAPMRIVVSFIVLLVTVNYVTADDTCVGYFDSNLNWHDSFECNGFLDGGDECCGTLNNKYCCYFDSSDTGETCSGYLDDNNNWQSSFDCDGIFDGGIYCCGTLTNKYCCYNSNDRVSIISDVNDAALSLGIIFLIIICVSGVVIAGVILCICICCCNACKSSPTTTTSYVHTGQTNLGPTVVTTSNMTQQAGAPPPQGGYYPPPAPYATQSPPGYGQATAQYYPK